MSDRRQLTQCDWKTRSDQWIERTHQPTRYQRKRETRPLILCGHGVSLTVDKGTLLIRDGLTHYPQTRVEHRIFSGDPTRPTRLVALDGSGSLTFDVIDWLREQDIALIRIDWTGAVSTIAHAHGYAADPVAWQRQETLRADPVRRMAIARRLISAKLEGSIATLEACIDESHTRAHAIGVITQKLAWLRDRKRLTVLDLYGAEGRAAKVYFDAWIGAPLTWTATKRRPVPEAWRGIGQRQSFATGKKGKNYNATHPMHAMLNYAYAILESQVRLDAIAAGYDPMRGFLHSGFRASPALVLDLMEPLRPIIDAAILKFAQSEAFSGADFTLRADGVCRLNPQLARRVAQIAAETCANADSAVAVLAL